MKPARIFQQYIWIINTLRQYKKLSLEELNNLWQNDDVNGGAPLSRTTFNRHKDSILDMFGIIIECTTFPGYKYYIANPEVLGDDSIEGWLFSTLTVSTVLSDSVSLRERILLENVPAGEEFLQTIIQALKANRKLLITYQRFGQDSYEKTIFPYALKLFHQRWYLLAFTGRHYATYSLDRMLAVSLTEETFERPDDFSPEAYFSEYYGILTDDTPMAHVVIRTYGSTPNYLRTLPLHATQKELQSTDEYTDFSLDIRPTADFINTLLSHSDGLEVLEPADLRLKICKILMKTLNRY